ncbi:MAG: class II aldolase/adducin family protein [Planctomycetota bacterium]
MNADEMVIRREMVVICQRLYDKDIVPANGGNVSVRLASGEVLVSPTGRALADATPEWFVKVDLDGNKLAGDLEPSCETPTHTFIYRRRPDVHGVIHGHPPFATAMALAGERFGPPSHPEAFVYVGEVAWIDYATPATLADHLAGFVERHDAFLLGNHGALTLGSSLKQAHFCMESLEMHARAITLAKIWGGAKPLPQEAVEQLDKLRRKLKSR